MKSVSASVGMVKGRHRSWLGVTTACSKLPEQGSVSQPFLLEVGQAALMVALALGVTALGWAACCSLMEAAITGCAGPLAKHCSCARNQHAGLRLGLSQACSG